MKFLKLKSHDPYLNLAIEEYIFENSSDDVFILWQNENTVVIGKNQNAYSEINLDFVKSHDIHIARRITGGGAVYHDLGNLNYSFISSKAKDGIDFQTFSEPILLALKTLSLDAELSGRNDIVINGKKISGNAQYSRGGRVLHHGTLLFDSDLNVLSSALKVDAEKISSKAIKSVRSRVTNICSVLNEKISLEEFIALITKFVIENYGAEEIETPSCREIELLAERNKSDDWLFPKKEFVSNYSIRKKKRFDFGSVEIVLTMNNDVIKDAKIFGDFFELKSVSEFESSLINQTFESLNSDPKKITVEKYIYGMTFDDFYVLLTN